jgi:hypothetical protein
MFAWPLLQWKSNKYYILRGCVCRLSYLACKAHMPCGLPGSTILFHILSHKWHDIWKKLLNIKCVVWFSLQLLSETFLIVRSEWDNDKNVYWSSCKLSLSLVRCQWNLNFPDRFSKTTQILNFMKIHSMGVEMFHVEGWTDMTKQTVDCYNFGNVPRNHSNKPKYQTSFTGYNKYIHKHSNYRSNPHSWHRTQRTCDDTKIKEQTCVKYC